MCFCVYVFMFETSENALCGFFQTFLPLLLFLTGCQQRKYMRSLFMFLWHYLMSVWKSALLYVCLSDSSGKCVLMSISTTLYQWSPVQILILSLSGSKIITYTIPSSGRLGSLDYLLSFANEARVLWFKSQVHLLFSCIVILNLYCILKPLGPISSFLCIR